jgi:thiosulfate/3-mercaptopyruvate sulfurtransferase
MRRLQVIAGLLAVALAMVAPKPGSAAEPCGAQRMTPATLDRALAKDNAANVLIMDTRSREDFFAGTVPGAINAEALQDIVAGIHTDSRGAYVVVVTEDGGLEGAALVWVGQLCDRGIETWVLQGGVSGWLAAGFGLEKPEDRHIVPGTVPFIIPRGLCEMNNPVQEFN